MMLGVSIIHGARRLQEDKEFRPTWPRDLAEHFNVNYSIKSDYYIWDGGVLTSITDDIIDNYAKHLVELFSRLDTDSKKRGIVIIGKSLGAIIAELALDRIAQSNTVDFKVYRLIRIATPDFRKFIYTKNVRSVIDLYSVRDFLYMVSIVPLTIALFLFRRYKSKKKTPIVKCRLKKLTHDDFNKNLDITLNSGNHICLYDLYALLSIKNKAKMNFVNKPTQKKSCR